MNILIVNCGSSSQSFKVYSIQDAAERQLLINGKAQNVATVTKGKSCIKYWYLNETKEIEIELTTHRSAALACIRIFDELGINIDAIGHRFVHGGKLLTTTTQFTPHTSKLLEKCLPLAPIHNPNSYSVVQAYCEVLPEVPQFLVFDTAFHASMPEAAKRYAIPTELADQYGFQKYGFHGLSYQYVSAKAATLLGIPQETVKLIMCHLGTGGASVAAFTEGHTIDTSMGYSPLPGLVMSTRCGDLDPEIVLELLRQGKSVTDVDKLLNTRSGLLGLSGYSSNLMEIIGAAENGNERCQVAYEVYANRLRNYVGGYYWQMNGADAIVFTDDVGTRCWRLREKVCGEVGHLGIHLDVEANRLADPNQVQFVNTPDSNTRILSMPTDEERVILEEVIKALK